MANELFSTLESKVQALIDEVELLRLEVSELREDKASLEAEKAQWEQALGRLVDKLAVLDQA